MKLLFVQIYGGKKFREEACQNSAQRIEAMIELAKRDVDAVLLPAGYLCAKNEKGAQTLAERTSEALMRARTRTTVVFGIDGWTGDSKTTLRQPLPFFVHIMGRGIRRRFRQLVRSGNESLPAQPWGNRTLDIAGVPSTVLACGEARHDDLQKRVAAVQPALILVPAHRAIKFGKGPRSWEPKFRALKTATGARIVIAEHTRSGNRHPHAYAGHPGTPMKWEKLPPMGETRGWTRVIEV